MNAEKPGPIRFSVKKSEGVAIVEFELTRNLTPEDLKNLRVPDPVDEKFSHMVVIISGKGPVWLYSYITHLYHVVKVLAIYDPRIDKGIVTASHSPDYSPGDLIDIPD